MCLGILLLFMIPITGYTIMFLARFMILFIHGSIFMSLAIAYEVVHWSKREYILIITLAWTSVRPLNLAEVAKGFFHGIMLCCAHCRDSNAEGWSSRVSVHVCVCVCCKIKTQECRIENWIKIFFKQCAQLACHCYNILILICMAACVRACHCYKYLCLIIQWYCSIHSNLSSLFVHGLLSNSTSIQPFQHFFTPVQSKECAQACLPTV